MADLSDGIVLSDRGVQAILVLVAAAAAGLAGLGIAWSGAAATLFPQIQMPYIVSGAFGGIAVTGTALAVLAIHVERRRCAAERAHMETLIASAAGISEDLIAAIDPTEGP